MRFIAPFLSALTLLACSTDSGLGTCRSDGECTSSVRGKVTVSLKADDLAAATIQGCRKPQGGSERGCSKAVSGTVPTSSETISFVLDGAIPATAFITKNGTGFDVEVSFSVESQTTTDGDEYTLDVLKADTTPVKDVVRLVTYSSVAPNGPECLPVCKVGTFTE